MITIEVTEKMLHDWGACESGIMEVAHLLPALISSEAEENYELAKALGDSWWRFWYLEDKMAHQLRVDLYDESTHDYSYNERNYRSIANRLAQIVVEAARSGE